VIIDLEQSEVTGGEFPHPDVCVVGAGAAGILVAVELVRRGKRVVIAEAGGRELEDQDPYRSEVSGLKHNGIHTGRFRIYGGSTTHWGGQILELDANDFTHRPWVPGSGWPFAKSTLESPYRRALELEGLVDVTLSDDQVWKEIGQSTPNLGQTLIPYFSRWCPEPNFTALHRTALEKREDLAIYLHANACGFVLNADGQSVKGIRCRTIGGKEAVFQAARYILCMGGIESSRFLLQPFESSPRTYIPPPWNKSGLVGRYYQDHIDCNCAEITDLDSGRFHDYFDNVFSRGYKYHPKFRLDPELQKENKTLNVAGTMVFKSDADEILNRLKGIAKNVTHRRLGGLNPSDPAFMVANLPLLLRQFYRYRFQHRMFNGRSQQILLRVHCEQEPLSSSSIQLAESRDALGLFRARLDWRVASTEMHTIRKYVETVHDTFAKLNLARVKIDSDLYGEDDRFVSKLDDSNHHMGGTRMSESGLHGVVDANLRMHALQNCYVCSCSVFPSSGFSNPTHTLLALAVRLAEHIADPNLRGSSFLHSVAEGAP
jgi:choline dehydrogenase-like flavoprotein